MAEVVPFRPTIIELAHNIASAFAQADKALDKAHSIRVQIGFDLIEAQKRFEAGELRDDDRFEGITFWQFIKNFNDRSLRDMRKCIALARAEDPEKAAKAERNNTRDRMRKHRAREQEGARAPPAEVVSIDKVQRALDLLDQAATLYEKAINLILGATVEE